MPERWLDGLVDRARARMSDSLFHYVVDGSGASTSAEEAPGAWDAMRFWPQVLREVTEPDLSTSLLGVRAATPLGVSPTSLQRLVHADGELAMAAACRDGGVPLVVSSNAGTTFAEIAATGVRWWLQVYLPAERALALPMLARAVAAGAEAVVLTVDTPVVAAKFAPGRSIWAEVDPMTVRVNFDAGYDDQPGSEKATDLGPHDLGWLAEQTGLPVIVKGVLRGDDARRCVEAGARAVWVSNHGGRQLDRAVPTAAALPEVVSEVGEQAEVYVDGGIRSGLDVLAALALGAHAVFLGRMPLLGLIDGQAGVARVLADLTAETLEAMVLSGCRRLSDTPTLVRQLPRSGR